jgi:hypothetical protein
MGGHAGHVNTTGQENSFIGFQAGYHNNSGYANNFIGYQAGNYNTTGYNNNFFGSKAGYSTTIGYYNSFMGHQAGYSNTSGLKNSFFGYQAGYSTTTSAANSFFGYGAGWHNTTGQANTAVGQQAGLSNITGSRNVFIGYKAGYSETGSNKLYISNSETSDPLIYGEFDNKIVKMNGDVIYPSDVRLKKDIEPLTSSLNKVINLKGVSYLWKAEDRSRNGFGKDRDIGLIAQDVEAVIPELVYTDSKGYKSLSYDKLVPVLVEAIKEQQKTIEVQNVVMKELKGEMTVLRDELNKLKNKDMSAK